MEEMEFYDVKSKKKFKTDKYEIREKDVKGKTRYFAVAAAPKPGTHECWRVVGAEKAKELMKQAA